MVKKIKNNKIIKRALIFISVLVVLCSTLALPVLAQAPDFEGNNFTTSSRYGRTIYCYENDNLVLYLQYDLDRELVPTTATTGTIVFTEYFYNLYYTGDVSADMSILNKSFTIYGTIINSGTIYQSVVSNTSLSSYIAERNMSQEYLEYVFEYGYENQFTYWTNQMISYEESFERGYATALNDYKAFEKGIFAIFNAPFTFVSNIASFEIFGISLIEVVVFILIICLAFVLLKFIGGSIL